MMILLLILSVLASCLIIALAICRSAKAGDDAMDKAFVEDHPGDVLDHGVWVIEDIETETANTKNQTP